MKRLTVAVSIVLAAAALWALNGSKSAAVPDTRTTPPLELYEQVPVPNVSGRIDHFTYDSKHKLVIFSALGSNTIEVQDPFAGKIVHTITGLNEPQGVLYVPDFDKIVVANAENGRVDIFDGTNYTHQKQIDLGEDADNVRYDTKQKKVLVGFGEEDGGIATIDPATNEQVGQVLKTGGHPESFQIETQGNRIFVNCPDAGNVVLAIDRSTGAVTKWPLKGLRGNYAMALNEEDHRLFTVARKDPTLVVLDTGDGREVARVPVAGECDDVYFDSERKRIYVIGAEGFISVVQEKDPDHYELIQNVPTTVGVRTGIFLPKRDRMYLGVPAKGSEPAQIWAYEAED
jgi:DNA-binding beta-propeller fold protein YncE